MVFKKLKTEWHSWSFMTWKENPRAYDTYLEGIRVGTSSMPHPTEKIALISIENLIKRKIKNNPTHYANVKISIQPRIVYIDHSTGKYKYVWGKSKVSYRKAKSFGGVF